MLLKLHKADDGVIVRQFRINGYKDHRGIEPLDGPPRHLWCHSDRPNGAPVLRFYERSRGSAVAHIHFVPVELITHITAKHKYLDVFTSKRQDPYLCEVSLVRMMGCYAERYGWQRVHRNAIVRVSLIEKINRLIDPESLEPYYEAQLTTGSNVRISRRRYSFFSKTNTARANRNTCFACGSELARGNPVKQIA